MKSKQLGEDKREITIQGKNNVKQIHVTLELLPGNQQMDYAREPVSWQ